MTFGLLICEGVHSSLVSQKSLITILPQYEHPISIGANKKAVYLRDIDASTPVRFLDTQSDVFAVFQKDVRIDVMCAQQDRLTYVLARACLHRYS